MDLPDTRSLNAESLELLRRVAVRGVFELGWTQKQIAELLGVSENTLSHWCRTFRDQGSRGLEVQPAGRPEGSGRSLTSEDEQRIRQIVCEDTPLDHDISSATWTRQAVAELIAKQCGVDLTLPGVGKYLRRWGLTPQKPARHAREQDEEEVQEFVEETLPEVVEQAEAEDGQLHFLDETGAKAEDQIGTSYAPKGETPVEEVPKTHIEQNLISSVTPEGDMIYWLFPGTMDAEKFQAFLERLVTESSEKIFVFADRLPAHEAKSVGSWLEAHSEEIELVWLPKYSPEYNPDEFLNNDLKQELKNEPMPEDSSAFRETMRGILDHIQTVAERVQGYFPQSKLELEPLIN